MKTELLSPAGDMESFKAGILAGCDAVYLGGPKFSARAYAQNFTDEDLKEVIKEAKLNNIKIYITINTLLKDDEILEAYEYAVKVWNFGVDAIIIQDPGLIYLLSKYNKEIELHASTQMTIHNLKGAKYAHDRGLKRIVLSRELSIPEIEEISREFETEVFIQGALCISYSGKCLMSSLLGGRSGNRGRCAQSCRMTYSLLNDNNEVKASGFLLSPKDLNTLNIIEDIVNTGTSSLKIEGRMKRPEYIYETVKQYRNAIDGKDSTDKGILQIFNREGSSTAFLQKNLGKDLMAYNSPKNRGIRLGVVKGNFIKLETSLALGDGLSANDNGLIVTKIKFNGKEVKSAQANQSVEIFPKKFNNGDIVFKTSDSILMTNINKELKGKNTPKYKINLKVTFKKNEALELEANFKNKNFKIMGDLIEEAQTNPITRDKIIENLNKTGDYPFTVENIELDYSEGFIRIAKLNEFRRNLYDEILEEILTVNRNEEVKLHEIENDTNNKLENSTIKTNENANTNSKFKYYVQVNRIEHFEYILSNYKNELENGLIKIIVYPIFRQEGSISIKYLIDFDKNSDIKYYVKYPEIMKSEFDSFNSNIKKLKNMIGLVTDNLGAIEEFSNGTLDIIGDYKLNIFNSYGEYFFNNDMKFTLSEELNKKEISKIKNKDNKISILYGRLESMLSEYCPIGSTIGGRTSCSECSVPCVKEDFKLRDKLNEDFILRTDIYCRSYIYNSKVKNILFAQNELISMGIKSFRIDFIDENINEINTIIDAMLKKESVLDNNSTHGHYKRGVD